MHPSLINEIILLVVAAFIGGFVARSIKLPPVVGYLVSGVIFGLVGKSFIPSYENLFALSQVGISLLLFTLGFEISLNTIRRVSKKIILISIAQIVGTTLLIIPILLLFHFALPVAVLFSTLFSFSSTAVVLKILEEKGMLTNFPGNNVFILLLLQDLFIVPVIFLMPLLFNAHFQFPGAIVTFFITAIKPLIAFIVMYILSRVFLSKLFHILFRYPQQELTILATIFTAVLSIGVLSYFGLPQSIAAFFAGMLISEEGKNLAPLAAIKPLRDILLVLFFVMIGMLVNVPTLISTLPLILITTILILFIKFVVVFFILRFFKFIPKANVFISSYLSNIGEFAVVVAQIAFISHYIGVQQYENLLAIFIMSLILIPLITGVAKLLFEKYKSTQFVRTFMGDSHYFMRSTTDKVEDHVVILGHGRVGKEVRNLLDMGNVAYVVVDFDRRIIDTLSKNMKNAIYGDPTDIDVLKSAGIKDAKILVVALPDSNSQKIIIKTALRINPKITILCRSHIDEDKYELVNLGVNTIVIPEFEAGLRIGKKVLELLGFSEKNTLEMLGKLRKFHFVH
jgi:CPA2 family monovalent cation:H+ antiporter-2